VPVRERIGEILDARKNAKARRVRRAQTADKPLAFAGGF
jgi:hypothetical protein